MTLDTRTPEEREAARLAKNKQIAESRKATATKRLSQRPRVLELKIVENKLTPTQAESLRLAFLEAKWLRNAALADGWKDYDTKLTTVQVKTPKGTETRQLENLGSQVRQAVVAQIGQDIANLAKAKAAGMAVGKLKFAREVRSLDLKQAGSTYRFGTKSGRRVKVQGIKGWLPVSGTTQLEDKDLANAKLVKRADGYYLLVTAYEAKTEEAKRGRPTASLGLDFGVATHVTLSDGREYNFTVQESERLKRYQRKLERQVKGSKNREKTLAVIRREYLRGTRRKDDLAAKFVHRLLEEADQVFYQDDHLGSWMARAKVRSGGRSLQGSILGRVKARLDREERAVRVDRFAATSRTCKCGHKVPPMPKSQRFFACSKCGHTAPRDVHAAQTMIRFGTPGGPGEAPVEGLPGTSGASPMKQETLGVGGPGAEAPGSSAQA